MIDYLPVINLDDLFSDENDAILLADNARKNAANFRYYFKNQLESLSPDNFGKSIIIYEKILENTQKLTMYADLLYILNMSDEYIEDFSADMSEQIASVKIAVSFFENEILNLSQDNINEKSTSEFVAPYLSWINQIRSKANYIHTNKTEYKNNEKLPLLDELEKEFNTLWENMNFVPKKNYYSDKRLKSAKSYQRYTKINERIDDFTKIFTLIAKKQHQSDMVNGFKDIYARVNFELQIDDNILNSLKKTIHTNKSIAHDYYKIKSDLLGTKKLDHTTLSKSIFSDKITQSYSWEDAKKIVYEAYNNFSPKMGKAVEQIFNNNWVDAKPRDEKHSGAFCYKITPSCHPYALVNFHNTSDCVAELAHETGHAVNFMLASKQSYLNYFVPLMDEPVAIFGEMLVFQHMLKNTKSKTQKLLLLDDKIKNMLGNIIDLSGYHDFETSYHKTVREKGNIAPQELNNLWMKSLKESYGPNVILSKRTEVEWTTIHHFISGPFSTISYPLGECLANSLYDIYQNGKDPDFSDKFVALMEKGSSQTPAELLRPLGINIANPDFWQQGLNLVKKTVSEFRSETNNLGLNKNLIKNNIFRNNFQNSRT